MILQRGFRAVFSEVLASCQGHAPPRWDKALNFEDAGVRVTGMKKAAEPEDEVSTVLGGVRWYPVLALSKFESDVRAAGKQYTLNNRPFRVRGA